MNREQQSLIDPDRRRLLAAMGALGTAGALWPALPALAQKPWPERPISYVVPFPPGGLTDVAARQIGKALGEAERWNVVVENKPGGAANIGAAHVSHAAPDGYTWLAITLSHAANATLFAGRAGYDLTRDLMPLAGLASSPIMVVVNAKSAIRNMDDLARAARAKPLSAGSSGNGTPPHLTLALYQKLTGATLMHVPYKGGAPSLTDLIGGHLDVVFSNYPESLPHVKSGALRALALTTRERNADLPDVPTAAQVGLPDLIVENFTGVLAPAGTPPALAQRIGDAIVRQMSQPALQQSMAQLGFAPQPRGPEAFGAYLKSEVERWARIIRDADIQIA